jgi:hypothetical protein
MMMMTNLKREIDQNGVTLLLLGLNGKRRTNDGERAAIESIIDTMTHGYRNFKQLFRLQELETKVYEKSLDQEEKEDFFNRLKVKNEDNTMALYMRHNAAAEQEEEEEPAGDVDVEDDTDEGYKDEEDAE